MKGLLFALAVVLALVGVAVGVRFLLMAWSDHRFGRDRRQNDDRRRRNLKVPLERRRRERRL